MWQMNRISKNTLLNISKYSNKLIKWAKYVFESNQPIIINELSSLGNLTNQVELLEAFDKDLIKNVNDIYELQKLIITTKEDGTIPELSGEEKNLKVLFGDNYDEKQRLLKLPSITLSIDKPIQKDEIKNTIIRSFLGIDIKEYKLLLKTKDKLKEIEVSELNDSKDKINYIINKADIDFVSKYTQKIADLVNSIFDIRKNLDIEEKDLIDTRITSGRTMIDGVLENSTYISKREGVYNISLKHKGDEEVIEKIYEGVKDSGYISGVEIDQDTDLNKVLFLINQIKNLHLNIDKEFEFKVRKLGNYRYNGMYLHDDINAAEFGFSSNVLNIVSVDVNAPTALIHELVHLVDLSNEEFLSSPNRKDMISYFTKKLNDNGIKDFYQKLDHEYLLRGNEIIARLGEIGYILNKYDYRGHESQEDLIKFYEKVKECQKLEEKGVAIPSNLSEIDFELFKQKQNLIKKFDSTFINEDEKFIPVVKNIDFYRKNSKSFFDIDNLTQEELLLIKEYSKSYFNVLKKDFIKLDNIEILKKVYDEKDEEEEVVKEKTTRNKYISDDFIFSKINNLNIDNVLKEIDKNEVMSWKEFLIEYGSQRHHLFRTSFSLNNDKIMSQIELNNKIVDHLIKNDDKENLSNFVNAYMIGIYDLGRSYIQMACKLNNEIKRPQIEDIKFIQESLSRIPETLNKALKHLNIERIDYNLRLFRPQLEVDRLGLKNTLNEITNNLNKFEPNSLAFVKILWSAVNQIKSVNEINYYANLNVEQVTENIKKEINVDNIIKCSEFLSSEILRHKEAIFELCKSEFQRCLENKNYYSYNNEYPDRYKFVSFDCLNKEFIEGNLDKIIDAINPVSFPDCENITVDKVINKLSFKHLKYEEGIKILEKIKFEDIEQKCKSLQYNSSYNNLSYNKEITKNCNNHEKNIFAEMLRNQNILSVNNYIENYVDKVKNDFERTKDRLKPQMENNKEWCTEIKDFYLRVVKQLMDKNQLDNFNKSLMGNELLGEIKKSLGLESTVSYPTDKLIESYNDLIRPKIRSLKI